MLRAFQCLPILIHHLDREVVVCCSGGRKGHRMSSWVRSLAQSGPREKPFRQQSESPPLCRRAATGLRAMPSEPCPAADILDIPTASHPATTSHIGCQPSHCHSFLPATRLKRRNRLTSEGGSTRSGTSSSPICKGFSRYSEKLSDKPCIRATTRCRATHHLP